MNEKICMKCDVCYPEIMTECPVCESDLKLVPLPAEVVTYEVAFATGAKIQFPDKPATVEHVYEVPVKTKAKGKKKGGKK